jgi:carboxylesterase type B
VHAFHIKQYSNCIDYFTGFFSTSDSVIPGNMGLMDQIEAINWVKRYISYFGGDPNMITIAGHSAGSMSVSLLTMSPKSQSTCLISLKNISQ